MSNRLFIYGMIHNKIRNKLNGLIIKDLEFYNLQIIL